MGMTSDMMDDEDLLAKFAERIPLGRVCEPDEIAAVIAFLASDDASFMTGANVAVDGGVSASNGQPAAVSYALEVQHSKFGRAWRRARDSGGAAGQFGPTTAVATFAGTTYSICTFLRSASLRACSQPGNHIAIAGKISTSTTQRTWMTMKSAMPR